MVSETILKTPRKSEDQTLPDDTPESLEVHRLRQNKILDIEDLDHGLVTESPNVTIRRRRKVDPSLDDIQLESFVPGTHKIYVKTWGCSHNNSDSEYMAGILASNGYQIVSSENEAHLWLLNSCTVKNPAEDHFKNYIMNAKNANKHIVVAGCVAQSSASSADYLKDISVVGVMQIDKICSIVEETLKGNTVRILGQKKDPETRKKLGGPSLNLPKIRKNPLIEIIPISTGCLNQCTYCKTKHARGDLGSYTVEEIVDRAAFTFKNEGIKEIWLTSEDTGAYGRDIGTDLPSLMFELIKVIPDGSRLRLGMTNPPYILEHLDQMAVILSNPKIYSFLHIPVQSGSDYVLGDMKREYNRSDFERIVDFLKANVKGINIATDIICGFPTETEEMFLDTVDLVNKYKFTSLFINQFYPRPGTPAASMKRIDTAEVKRRSRMVSDVFESYKPYDGREGSVYDVLVTEESKDKRFWVGHNQFYEQILIPKEKQFLGQMVTVRITSTGKHFMMADVIEVKPEVKNHEVTDEHGSGDQLLQIDQNGTCCGSNGCCLDPSSLSPTTELTQSKTMIQVIKEKATVGNLWMASCLVILTVSLYKKFSK